MKKNFWILLLTSTVLFVGCKKDEEEPDDNELITNVKLKFTESGTTTVTTFEWKDSDGDGGAAPTKFDKISLKPNKTYGFTIELFDDSKSPVANISEEVSGEADEHLFVYTPTPASLLTFTITDKDSKNYHVGLKADVKTTAAGSGKLKVQLRHQPGTKNGTATPGSDDVNLDFDVEIK